MVLSVSQSLFQNRFLKFSKYFNIGFLNDICLIQYFALAILVFKLRPELRFGASFKESLCLSVCLSVEYSTHGLMNIKLMSVEYSTHACVIYHPFIRQAFLDKMGLEQLTPNCSDRGAMA